MDGEPRCRAKKLARRQTTSIWNVGFVLGFLSYSHIFSTLPSKKFPKICLKTTLYTLPKCRGILYMNPERTTDSAKLLMRRLILREFVDPSDRGSGWDWPKAVWQPWKPWGAPRFHHHGMGWFHVEPVVLSLLAISKSWNLSRSRLWACYIIIYHISCSHLWSQECILILQDCELPGWVLGLCRSTRGHCWWWVNTLKYKCAWLRGSSEARWVAHWLTNA